MREVFPWNWFPYAPDLDRIRLFQPKKPTFAFGVAIFPSGIGYPQDQIEP